jgi:hypothetical protein
MDRWNRSKRLNIVGQWESRANVDFCRAQPRSPLFGQVDLAPAMLKVPRSRRKKDPEEKRQGSSPLFTRGIPRVSGTRY